MSKLAENLKPKGYGDRPYAVQEGTANSDLLVAQNPGNDFLFGRDGNDTLIAGAGQGVNEGTPNENLQPNASVDLNPLPGEAIRVTPVVGPPSVTDPGTAVAANSPLNLIIGTSGNDNFGGTGSNDIVVDFRGNDVINSGNGDDLVLGGAGDDTLIGAAGLDTLLGAQGADRFIWNNGDGSDTIEGGVGTDINEINGAAEGDTLNLGQDDQGQSVLGRTNLKPFNLGADSVERIEVNGLVGDDSFTVSDLSKAGVSSVRFAGGEGNDTLQGNGSTSGLQALGDVGNDILQGGLVDDTFWGGEGDDRLNGFLGNDTLEGGAGLDQFIFGSGRAFGQANPGIDTIKDFNANEDKIALSKTTFASLQSEEGDGFSQSSEFAIVGNESDVANSEALVVAVRGATGTNLFYNANGAEAGLGVGAQFATLEGVTGDLSTHNFVFQA